MARKPPNMSWSGFTTEQAELLDFLDYLGNDAWARNNQTEELMPNLLRDLQRAGLSLERVRDAMESIGYGKRALHQLERWELKRTTGRFGR